MRKFSFLFLALLFTPLINAHAMSSSSLINMINAERTKAGLSAVAENSKLDQAAKLKADDMAAKGYFEHIGPDGKDPWSWFAIVGYDWSWAGEILAMNANTESETAIVEAWINSPEHKKIIMDARYTEVGLGIATGTYQGQRVVFVAGEFGLPKASVPAPAPKPTIAAPVNVSDTVANTSASVAKAVTKAVSKPAESLVKKAEAKEVLAATTSAEQVSSVSKPVANAATAARITWVDWLRNLLAQILAKWA